MSFLHKNNISGKIVKLQCYARNGWKRLQAICKKITTCNFLYNGNWNRGWFTTKTNLNERLLAIFWI